MKRERAALAALFGHGSQAELVLRAPFSRSRTQIYPPIQNLMYDAIVPPLGGMSLRGSLHGGGMELSGRWLVLIITSVTICPAGRLPVLSRTFDPVTFCFGKMFTKV